MPAAGLAPLDLLVEAKAGVTVGADEEKYRKWAFISTGAAGLLAIMLAVVLVMFSLENRPRPAPQGLAADVLFDGRVALRELRGIVDRRPDRRPGQVSSAALAREMQPVARDLRPALASLREAGFLRTVVPAAPDAWILALERYGTMSFGEAAPVTYGLDSGNEKTMSPSTCPAVTVIGLWASPAAKLPASRATIAPPTPAPNAVPRVNIS